LSKPARLDAELVRRGLAGSRAEAKSAIEQGQVVVRGVPASRATTLVSPADPITLAAPAARFVSRGGDKLDRALARLDVEVAGRRWLDAGASTGGFTDRLLQGGATAVIAADVGYGQLDWRLRNDERVVVIERLNLRELTPEHLPWRPAGVVADLSFISLRLVLPALVAAAEPGADFVLLVKPQFEVGRDSIGKGGVVRDPELWVSSMEAVADAAAEAEIGLRAAVPSEVPGPAGNREFFLHLRRGAAAAREILAAAAREVAP
jgi:23S rRNA (cytidine1920-2'-O)/16S rRNA (cytidine1409-2'-O)-methyltransferase